MLLLEETAAPSGRFWLMMTSVPNGFVRPQWIFSCPSTYWSRRFWLLDTNRQRVRASDAAHSRYLCFAARGCVLEVHDTKRGPGIPFETWKGVAMLIHMDSL